jgi:hypothetical protein
MAYNYFVTRINAMVRSMESAANLVLQAMADAQAGLEVERAAREG